MRITRESLLKIIRDTINQQTRANRGIMAVYLHGSLLEDEFILGGTADIDLFYLHTDDIVQPREIIHLSEDVHLDIAHHAQRDYRNTRLLRLHPWLGPTLHDCKIQYDPQHFLDFTQASVRGQYDRPDFIVTRSRKQLDSARQIWAALHEAQGEPAPKDVLIYLRALENAANAIVIIYGQPLTERRFLLNLPKRLEAAGKPGIYPGLLGLLGAPNVDAETMRSWLPAWQAAFQSAPAEQAPPKLHPARWGYYHKAVESLLGGSQPATALWPLLRSWTLAVSLQPEASEQTTLWQSSLEKLALTGSGFSARVAGLDVFLDMVEESLDNWAAANGVSDE